MTYGVMTRNGCIVTSSVPTDESDVPRGWFFFFMGSSTDDESKLDGRGVFFHPFSPSFPPSLCVYAHKQGVELLDDFLTLSDLGPLGWLGEALQGPRDVRYLCFLLSTRFHVHDHQHHQTSVVHILSHPPLPFSWGEPRWKGHI